MSNFRLCAASTAVPADLSNPDSSMECAQDSSGTSVDPGDAQICSFEGDNGTGHTVGMKWLHNGVPVTSPEQPRTSPGAGSSDHGWWWYYLWEDPHVPTGKWTCEITLDGAVVAKHSYTVTSTGAVAPLRVYEPGLDSLDPAIAYSSTSWAVLNPTCAGLVAWKDASGAQARTMFPDAATAMPTVSSDGLTYTFTIRSGMGFAPPSTESVTPASFVRAFQRAARVPSSPASSFASVIQGFSDYASGTATSISGLTASGSQLRIRLTQRTGDFLARLTMPFFCAVPKTEPLTAQTIVPSAGPYYLAAGATASAGGKLVLNPHYGGQRPHGAATIKVINGSTPRYGIESDAVDGGFYFSNDDWGQILAGFGPSSSQKRAYQWLSGLVDEITFDTSIPQLNAKVRKAIATGIDRTALAGTAGAYLQPSSNLLSPNEAGYSATGPYGLRPDLTTARSLMSSAGYSSTHRLALTFVCKSACNTLGPLLTSELAKFYIDLTVQQVSNLYSTLDGTDWDLAAIGWIPDYPDPWDNLGPLFGTGGAANYAHYSAAAFDSALESANEKSGSARSSAFAALASSLATGDVPATTYDTGSDTGFFSTRVECVTHGAYGVNLSLLNDKNTGAACGSDAGE